MQQHDIQYFLERYFRTNQCDILEKKNGLLKTRLTVELDKLLMNRPFYWQFVESTGQTGEPTTLTLLTQKQTAKKGEFIHFGSPRLHQIFKAAKENAAYIRLYENVTGNKLRYLPLIPWLMLNVKISYVCHLKKDELLSLGLQLINGNMIKDMVPQLKQIKLAPKLSDFTYPLTPLIKPQSAINRMKRWLFQQIASKDDQWAQKAEERWAYHLHLLDRFYENKERDEVYYNEKAALETQYKPKIHIEVINGGLIFLQDGTMNHTGK